MNIELIETFLNITETRNFNRSAERLNITQSTVSSRIKTLEQGLGTQLFERGRTGAELTAEGRRFESYARNIRLSWNLARQDLGMPEGYDGVLRVAAQVSLRESLLHHWVVWLRQEFPKTGIHVEADYSKSMIDDLMFGNLDIGVLYTPQYLPDLEIQPLLDERFMMVSSEQTGIDDLKLETYIRMGYSPHFITRHVELLPRLQHAPLTMGLYSLAEDFIKSKGGSCYLPAAVAQKLITEDGFFAVPDAPEIKQPVYIAYLVRNRHKPEIRKAVKALQLIAIE